jgi:hypothetical protein
MIVKMKCLAVLVVFGFLAGSARGDNPKTYRVTVSAVSMIGTTELQPGDYKLRVDPHGTKVVFTHVDTGKEIELEATVGTAEQKFENTAIHSDLANGTPRIVEIRLGGSKTKVGFK